jgi:hypothetical protein
MLIGYYNALVKILLEQIKFMPAFLPVVRMQNLQDAKYHQSLQEVSGSFRAVFDLKKRQ